MYGELLAIPAARVRVVADGERVALGGRMLELIHTPGHAQHHYVVVDAAHASIFSGDTFGISYRALDTENGAFITPSTVPTQFDPEQHIAHPVAQPRARSRLPLARQRARARARR